MSVMEGTRPVTARPTTRGGGCKNLHPGTRSDTDPLEVHVMYGNESGDRELPTTTNDMGSWKQFETVDKR